MTALLTPVVAGETRPIARPRMWPSRRYTRQVARLRRMVGQPVYIVELTFNGLSIGAVFHGEPRVLLDVRSEERRGGEEGRSRG